MGSVVARFLLFLSSYFPLAAIFYILFVSKQPWVAASILFVGLIGLLGMAWYLHGVQKIEPIRVEVSDVQKRDAEAMSYIVTYIIPFLAIPFSGWEQGLALLIFFLVLGFLYVNSNMIHINPMLNLAGYRLYEITLEDGAVHSLITRRRIVRGETLSVIKAGEDILMEKAS
jgi:hypothetical protein